MPRALIIVDVQPTFCEGGALAVQGGNAIAEAVARFVDEHRGDYALIATTQDWHIDPGTHFSDSPDFVDTWPPHGVAGTPEAELHPALAFGAARGGAAVLGAVGAVLARPAAAMGQAIRSDRGGRHQVIESDLTVVP